MARLSGKAGNIFVANQLVEDCEDTWVGEANVTASADSTDYKIGSASAKFVVDAAFTTGLIATEAISPTIDLSSYAQIMAWVKSSVNLTANDWKVVLGDAVQADLDFNIPALTAATWKLIRVTGTLTAYTAVNEIKLNQVVDKGAMNFWIDEVRAAKAVAGIKSWTLDQDMSVVDTTGFDSSGHRTYLPILGGWRGSFEGFKDGAPLIIGTIYHLELRESATATQQYRGSALITGLHANTPVDGVVTYGYDFQGTDILEIATA